MLRRGLLLALLTVLVLPAAAGAALQGQTVLVSAADGSSAPFDDPTDGVTPIGDRTMSADGTKVLVASSFDQGLSFAPRGGHLFVRGPGGQATLVDRTTGTGGPAGDGDIGQFSAAAISADGRYVAFATNADNLSPLVGGRTYHAYLRDTVGGTTQLVDVTPSGNAANAAVDTHDVSVAVGLDGHVLVAFSSTATDIVDGDTNGKEDVFLRDVTAGTTTLISARDGTAATFGDGDSDNPRLSGDGRFVAFDSRAKNLTADTVNGFVTHVFRRQARTCSAGGCTAATATVQVDRVGVNQSDRDAFAGSISDDGTAIAYTSSSAILGNASGDNGTDSDVFLWREAGPSVEYVSTNTSGESADTDALDPSISRDGKLVAFVSTADNLAPGVTDFTSHTYVRDLAANTIAVADRANGPTGAVENELYGGGPSLGTDGSKVDFSSADDAVSAADDDDYLSTYVRDLSAGTTTLMTGLPGGPTGFGDSFAQARSVSADGRYVAFLSDADGLAPGAASHRTQVFRRDLLTGRTVLVSRATGADGGVADAESFAPAISADGQRVAFISLAGNLGADTTQPPGREVYVRDLATSTTIPISRPPGQTTPGDVEFSDAISGDGHHVAFVAKGKLVADADTRAHVYEQNVDAGARELLDRGPGATGAIGDGFAASGAGTIGISDDGSRVAFVSSSRNLGATALPGFESHAWVRDVPSETSTLLDSAGGTRGDGQISGVALSGDGAVAAFTSTADNLGADADTGQPDVFVRDIAADHATWVAGSDGASTAGNPSLDRTGAHLAFTTDAQLDPADVNPALDAYVLDRATGAKTLASRADGPAGHAVTDVMASNEFDPAVAISASGQCVAFGTDARDVAGPTSPDVPDAARVYERAVSGDCPAVPPAGGGGTPPPGRGNPPSPRDTVAPRLTRVSLTRKRFRVGRNPTAITARAKAGTILRFTLSETAGVKIAIVRETKVKRHGKRKLKLVAAGTLSRAGRRGTNLVAFSGRVGHRKLKAGRYRFVLTATDPAGNRSKTTIIRFAIVTR